MADVEQQLREELRGSIKRALATHRPILTHLNGDTTWVLQLPYPRERPSSGRSRFNILIDPWLVGPQSDVAAWFSTQWHVIAPSVQSIAELEERLKEVEQIAQEVSTSHKRKRSSLQYTGSYIDAVALSHEFSDHTHQATLLEINPTVPVFATDKAASLVKSWNHFNSVTHIPPFSGEDANWKKTSLDPLPDWLGISRVVTKDNALYYHSALLIAFESKSKDGSLQTEAVIYSPHGIVADDLRHLPAADPPIHTLALLHGLHDIRIKLTKQLNLGAHNGLRAQRICQAKYWVGTHDEVKKGGGLVASFLRRSIYTFQEALDLERSKQAKGSEKIDTEGNGQTQALSGLEEMKDVNFAELRSGESLLLA